MLYIRLKDSQYQVWENIAPHRYKETRAIIPWDQLPSDATPAMAQIQYDGQSWRILNTMQISHPETNPVRFPPETFAAYIKTLAEWKMELLQLTELYVDPYHLCIGVEHGIV